jgi:parallel beta-helix repeat protein
MLHPHPLVLSLIIIISSICPIAAAKTDCVNCGIDGREMKDSPIITFDSPKMDYYLMSDSNGVTLIDFESFADRQNINGLNLGGVTLTCPASGIVEIFKNRCVGAFHSPTTAIGTNICGCITTNPLVGVFDYPATYIGLWAGDGGGDTDSWELEAFDAPVGGNSLGIVRSGDWNGNPYRKLEINASNIWRFEARWTGAECGVAYDDLEFFIPVLSLEKVTDVNEGDCVLPGREITYTINYSPAVPENNNMRIIDYLPVEADYNSSSPVGDYNATTRTITWTIGSISSGDRGIIKIDTQVNNLAEPCTVFTNRCELRGDLIYNVSEVNTPVCVWNPEVIYVDCNRVGGRNNGMSWQNAYLDLQNALNRASIGGGSEIWVAKGTYITSVKDPCAPYYYPFTFKLVNNIPTYGHFVGNETHISQRDFNNLNNETILSGSGYYTITASGLSQNNILDGFTITGGNYSRITISNAHLTVSNCIIDGTGYITGSGIAENGSGSALISNCIICNNKGSGISHSSSSSNLTVVTRCKIFANSSNGIWIGGSSNSDIRDNWIYRNNSSGIWIEYQTAGPTTIRNNTIFGNKSYGIVYQGGGTSPVTTSSIILGNSPGDLIGCSGSYLWLTANGDPCFVNADANDFHLRPASLCIDAGDPCFMDFNDTDIDGERRITDGDHDCVRRVDIGADEFGWPMADFNKDKIVDFVDFAIFANSWKTIDPAKSFDSDNDVDIADLAKFCEEWLWYRPKPDLDRNHKVDFSDFAMLAASWQTLDENISLDEDCDVDIYDLKIFCDHWLLNTE